MLFGSSFLTMAKDHAESVKASDKLSSRRGRPTGQPFFQSGRPFNQAARGGGSYGSSHRAGSNNAYQNGNSEEEVVIGHTWGGTSVQESSSSSNSNSSYRRACSLHTRDCVSVQRFTSSNMCATKTKLLPIYMYLSDYAHLAKQGNTRHSCRATM